MSIDPQSFEPTYQQLARILRDKIISGEWEPGRLLPSEAQLIGEYGVGRVSVRRALDVLRSEGFVTTVPRVGTFVRAQVEATVVRVSADTRITARMPTLEERRKLDLPAGVPLLVVEREGRGEEIFPADRTVIEVD